MFSGTKMVKIVDEVVRDHDLPYHLKRVYEPPDKSWTWCAELIEPTTRPIERTFEICVRWPFGSTYDSVKADFARQALAHVQEK